MSTQPQHPPSRGQVARERSAAGLAWTREKLRAARFVRPRHGRIVAGVLAGLARRFGVGAGILRVAFLVPILLPGPQVVAYLVLWVLMPQEA